MKNILVCGAAGFIGGALFRALTEKGITASVTLGRNDINLATPHGCAEAVCEPFDVVYLCAGVTGGSGIIATDPLSLVTPNVLIHLHMFDACKRAGVKKVVCLSSTTGYPDTDLPMGEEDYFSGELHPAYFNPGHTRRFIERLGAMYPELNIVFLRPSVVYGPGDDFDLETCHVIPALVRKVAERQDPITIWGDGSNWRDGVYIDDMARALVLAAEAPAGAYNIASGEGNTVMWILNALIANKNYQTGETYSPKVLFDLSKPSMLKKRVLNIDKSNRVMDWEPTVTLWDGLRNTLEWYASR